MERQIRLMPQLRQMPVVKLTHHAHGSLSKQPFEGGKELRDQAALEV